MDEINLIFNLHDPFSHHGTQTILKERINLSQEQLVLRRDKTTQRVSFPRFRYPLSSSTMERQIHCCGGSK